METWFRVLCLTKRSYLTDRLNRLGREYDKICKKLAKRERLAKRRYDLIKALSENYKQAFLQRTKEVIDLEKRLQESDQNYRKLLNLYENREKNS